MRRQIRKSKLRHYRRLLDFPQTELAEACVLKRVNGQISISSYELGLYKCPEALRVKISGVLGLPVETVFPEDTDRPGAGVGNEKTKNRPI